ncbi:ATP-binding cassette domain-containing protein [Corynebacterium uberis]|uniref:ATP-binding cassette domain-containing protein n=1 Tax=Corynebacterium TaxID=1716 RepID=UPI001D0BC2B7|nr:ATP-binding cassette domain-containing protein [Corynebacterium uberis]UDL76715.1 ATP-binding cassette domain-containing protein [Corynebacterium uberis]UDL78928.1 ATP-binding cassette domain-containing protein [Corynebacterium uberis]UDL81206.1 ATP-binding cassette domain-containing protein [Corynebacterium uberis]UDL83344.1 ATP-binding cassette domain-containing protein [Corynebacterium uberis]
MQTVVEVKDLSFQYSHGRPVLKGANCAFGDGLSVILGANGAGKSTLMGLLAGELKVQGGSIALNQDRARSVSAVGWVPQRSVFDPAQRLEDFVSSVGWLRGLSRKKASAAAKDALATVGLGDRSRDKLKDLLGVCSVVQS